MNACSENSDQMACPSCDQLYDMSGLEHCDKARCESCNHLLSTYREDAFVHVVAFSVAGLIFFVMACCNPFMSFKSSGLESVMTLPQTITQITGEGMWDLALIVACFILIIPAVVLAMSCALGASLAAGWRNYWAKDLAKMIFHLQTWSMVEVFFLAVLVSLVKIAHMATVGIGPAFWAYAAFSVCFMCALSNLDTFHTWKRLEELEP
jgi:paraquat-inducible protein A